MKILIHKKIKDYIITIEVSSDTVGDIYGECTDNSTLMSIALDLAKVLNQESMIVKGIRQ